MGEETAAQNHSVRVILTAPCFKWLVRLESHQHLPGYEPDALTVKLQTSENGRIPRCCPGLLLFPKQASAAGSLVSDERMDVRPGLAPGNVDLQTTGSTTSPCARIENGRIPRCCPGRVLVPNQARTAGSLVSDKRMDVHPRLALGNAVLRTADSALCLAHELKWFPQPVLPRHRFVHNEECCCYTMKGVLKWILR